MTYEYKKNEEGERQHDESGNFIVIDSKTKEERVTDLLVLLNDKIPTKNSEAEANRKENSKLKASLKEINEKYSVIGDPEEALKLINIAKSVSAKDLVDGAKAEQAKLDLLADSKQQIETLHKEYGSKLQIIADENTSLKEDEFKNFKLGELTNAKALKGTIYENHLKGALNEFGPNIKRDEEGKAVVVDWTGNIIRTTDPENMGQPAQIGEGLKKLIESHPNKGNILMAGTGGDDNSNPLLKSDGGAVNVTRAQVKAPADYKRITEQAAKEGVKVNIVD